MWDLEKCFNWNIAAISKHYTDKEFQIWQFIYIIDDVTIFKDFFLPEDLNSGIVSGATLKQDVVSYTTVASLQDSMTDTGILFMIVIQSYQVGKHLKISLSRLLSSNHLTNYQPI